MQHDSCSTLQLKLRSFLILSYIAVNFFALLHSWWEQRIERFGVRWRPGIPGIIDRSQWSACHSSVIRGWWPGRLSHWRRWNRHASKAVSEVSTSNNNACLMAIFQNNRSQPEPECLQSGLHWSKDDRGGGDNQSSKTCKAAVKLLLPTNQHPPFFAGWMPFSCPTNSVGDNRIPGVFQHCLDH